MLNDARRHYEMLYEMRPDARLYAAPWWLDATCGRDGWDVITTERDGVTAALPFFKTRIRGISANITPPLTQWVDWLAPPNIHTVFSTDLFNQALGSSILDISLKPGIHVLTTDTAYRTSTQYSYVLQPSTDIPRRYNDSLRQNLKQSAEHFTLDTRVDINKLVELYASVFAQKKMRAPWWVGDVLSGTIKILLDRGQAQMRFARRGSKTVAGSLIAWDQGHDYYLIGGRTASEDGLSAHAYLLHDALLTASARNHDFDFEGSMVPGIASFFQAFGARPVPFMRVRRFSGWGRVWSLLH